MNTYNKIIASLLFTSLLCGSSSRADNSQTIGGVVIGVVGTMVVIWIKDLLQKKPLDLI